MILDSMILRYLDRIGRCSHPRQVADALGQEAAAMGLSAVACWMLTGPKAASRNPFYANNWPQPWLDLYERRGFFEKDPFARWAISSGAPVSWGALLRRLPVNDPAHEIGLAARTFGFSEGFGAPVRSSTGHLGLFTFFGDRRPLSSGEQILLQAICPGTLHRMEALVPSAEPARPAGVLSARERECAALLCEGLSNPAIADRLGISVATVKFHLGNACAKLGARSRVQLAALLPAATKAPADGKDARIGAMDDRAMLLLRSADGRYFEIDSDVALGFEIKPGDDAWAAAAALAPPASAEPLAEADETDDDRAAANDVEPYWDWRHAQAVGARWTEPLGGLVGLPRLQDRVVPDPDSEIRGPAAPVGSDRLAGMGAGVSKRALRRRHAVPGDLSVIA